jgi:hypothetical protein
VSGGGAAVAGRGTGELLGTRWGHATALFDAAIEMDPCNAGAWRNRARLAFLRQEFGAAADDTAQAVRALPARGLCRRETHRPGRSGGGARKLRRPSLGTATLD